MHRARALRHAARSAARTIVRRERRSTLLPAAIASAAAELQSVRDELTAVRQDLIDAAQVQRRLSGPRGLRRGEYEIACETFAARQISGDFCTIFDEGQRTVLAIGDIGGKGLMAGMWFTHVVSLVRMYSAQYESPADAMSRINADLCAWKADPPLTTLLLINVEWQSNRVSYCRAGHPPAIAVRAGNGSDLLIEGGPILGALDDARFEEGQAQFAPGDALLAYSDGLSELRNKSGEEFGVRSLMEEVEQCDRSTAERMLFCMLGRAQDFAGVRDPEDDITMLTMLRRTES